MFAFFARSFLSGSSLGTQVRFSWLMMMERPCQFRARLQALVRLDQPEFVPVLQLALFAAKPDQAKRIARDARTEP